MTWATGKKAYGFCDRCGFRYPLRELKEEYVYYSKTGIRTCPICYDPDHPQLRVGRWDVTDDITLRDPRPDNAQAASRSLFGFNPVNGGPSLEASAGNVKIP